MLSRDKSVTVTDDSGWHCGTYHTESQGRISVLRIKHPRAECAISLHGGQVLSFVPDGGEDLLWMSELAICDGRSAVRGGVPVCWPWFGNHHDGAKGRKSHGFARTELWRIDTLTSDEKSAHIVLTLRDSEQTRRQFPYRFELKLLVTVGTSLKVELVVQNRDERHFEFTGALHGYFAVEDITQTQLFGLGTQCLDSVDDGQIIAAEEPLVVGKALDYVFCNPGRVVLKSHDCTSVRSEHADSLVVWNPWKEGAADLADMGAEEYRKMLCVEPAVLVSPVRLFPGEACCLDLEVSAGP